MLVSRLLFISSLSLVLQRSDCANFTIAGFFGVTTPLPSDPTKCAANIDHYKGIIFYEAFSYALTLVNEKMTSDNESYLYGHTILPTGYDTCQSGSIALGRVRTGVNALFDNRGIGMIGPLTTDAAKVMGPILYLYDMPAVSYFADGMDFDDLQKYPTLYRTIPSVRLLLEAILDLIETFKWKYVALIASREEEGFERAVYFSQMALTRNICVSKIFKLPIVPTAEAYDGAVEAIIENDKLSVVILLTTTFDTNQLLRFAKSKGVQPGKYTFIGTYDWNMDRYIDPSVIDMVDGSLVIGHRIRENHGFWDFLASRTINKNVYPFFRTFWENIFQCATVPIENVRNCTGNETLDILRPIASHVPVHLVIEAVLTLTCGFRHYMEELCPHLINRTECIYNETLPNGKLSSSFIWTGVHYHLSLGKQLNCPGHETVTFDQYGAGPADYVIYNTKVEYSKFTQSKIINYVEVGKWCKKIANASTYEYVKSYNISKDKVSWVNKSIEVPSSICSENCRIGEISFTDSSTTNPVCCFKCRKCPPNNVVINNTCVLCDMQSTKADVENGVCQRLPQMSIRPDATLSLVMIVFAVFGAVLTTVPTIFFIIYRDSRFVKASGKELCFLMFIGIYAGFLAPLVFLIPPTNFVCKAQWITSGVVLTIFYAPLVLKLNRVYRIFESARSKIKRPPLTSPLSQIMMCFGIIGIQFLVALSFVVSNGDTLVRVIGPGAEFIVITCSFNMFMMGINLAISLVLIAMCTFYAFKTRNFPANYNESKSIGATMYVTCILWAIFITAYFFTSDSTGKFSSSYLSVAFAVVLCYVTVCGIFGPKVVFICQRMLANEEIDCKPSGNTFVPSTVQNSMDLSRTIRINYDENTKLTKDASTETDDLFSLSWL